MKAKVAKVLEGGQEARWGWSQELETKAGHRKRLGAHKGEGVSLLSCRAGVSHGLAMGCFLGPEEYVYVTTLRFSDTTAALPDRETADLLHCSLRWREAPVWATPVRGQAPVAELCCSSSAPRRGHSRLKKGTLARRAPGPQGSPAGSLVLTGSSEAPSLCFRSRPNAEQRPEDSFGECCCCFCCCGTLYIA